MPEIAYNKPVPTDVLESAVRVKAWFDELGVESWEFLGICSRDHADKLREIRARIQQQPITNRALSAQLDPGPA